MNIIEINPKECTRWEGADRSGLEFGDIYALGRDIVKNGQIEPVIARPVENGDFKFEIITGSRRWKACIELGIPLKAIVKQLNDEEAFMNQIKENEKSPICDYSKGLCYQQALDKKILTVNTIAELSGYSTRKIYNFLAFTKVPRTIWDAVQNMSRVSSRSACMIYELSGKGEEYVTSLVEIAEDIRKGCGARSIKNKVMHIILGNQGMIDPAEKIKLDSGLVVGRWTKKGIAFEDGMPFIQEEVSSVIKQYFNMKLNTN